MAILRERLEELIKEEKTIWIKNKYCNAYSYDLTNYNYIGIADNKESLMFLDFSIQEDEPDKILVDYLDYLFETKEEAEFALEFQNIPRTETLNLPLFNNLPEELYIPFVRFDKEENIWIAYVLYIDSDEIAILFKDINERVYDCIFQKPVTKENYLEACKIAKKLFLGENWQL